MNTNDAEVLGYFVFVIIALLPTIFFLLTLQNTLKAIRGENRKMNPGEVWLMLIPFFGLIWLFIVVGRIADSIADECESRQIGLSDNRPTYNLGIAFGVCSLCSVIPMLGVFSAIAALVLWIIYWVKVNNYRILFGKNQNRPDILENSFS